MCVIILSNKHYYTVCKCCICWPFIVAFYLINKKTVLLLVMLHFGRKKKTNRIDKEIFTLKNLTDKEVDKGKCR